ncbi:MAG: hypothetical protein JSR80_06195 [Verrucomicrobia bacterium]|nr:hypothetical protein [Verrucomicrobiota bacterium]
MKKLTLRAALAAGLLMLGASPQVAADNCCGDFEIGAHALLFQPSTCRFDFAERINILVTQEPGATIPSTATVGTIDPNLHWGLRVWGDYIQDCMYLGVGYQWFQGNDSGSLGSGAGSGGVILRDNLTVLRSTSGKLHWRYQYVDVRIGGIQSSCNGEMYGFINGRWIDLEHKRFATGTLTESIGGGTTTITQNAREKAQFQGGALGLGVGGRRNLLCNFGITGELNIFGVIGKRQTTASFENLQVVTGGTTPGTTDTFFVPGYKSVTSVTPELDVRIGLDYTWRCNCWAIIGEVGYELDYFWNVFDFPNEVNPGLTGGFSGTAWRNNCDDVGFSGLFFGLHTLF